MASPRPPLSPQAQRLRTIMITVPIIAATSLVLYQRLVQGKPQRTLPRPEDHVEGRIGDFLPEEHRNPGDKKP
ncbi:hypothetical protein DENSPDRAFT_841184 [Dentipellis sp. KUC8613]|nr:hypothetical protein DENSPDRAFT_841184 [Dentipellis sp. KUC8613]